MSEASDGPFDGKGSNLGARDPGLENQRHTIKPLLWITAIPALAIGYYFGIALPSYNDARLALERERYSDEQRRRTEEASKEQQDATFRQRLLETCLDAAESAYWTYVKLNGTELKDGKVRAPMNVWNTADKRKNDDRDACFKQYPPR